MRTLIKTHAARRAAGPLSVGHVAAPRHQPPTN